MSNRLSADAVAAYRRDGFYFPVSVLSVEQAAGYRRCLEDYEAQTGGPIASNHRHKVHLLFTWANELVRHPAVLDAVEIATSTIEMELFSAVRTASKPATSPRMFCVMA